MIRMRRRKGVVSFFIRGRTIRQRGRVCFANSSNGQSAGAGHCISDPLDSRREIKAISSDGHLPPFSCIACFYDFILYRGFSFSPLPSCPKIELFHAHFY